MFKTLHQIWQSRGLRNKILFTLFVLFVFRVAAHITVPGVDSAALSRIFDQNSLLGVFSILTGGSMENFSIVLMGLSPYINASIIIQLMTVVIPKLETLSKEGMDGRKKLNQYTRILSVPLAFLQGYGMVVVLNQSTNNTLIPNISNLNVILPILITITAGTLFTMWLGELITERGIGNGISLLIFTGIVSGIPPIVGRMAGTIQAGDTTRLPTFAFFAVVAVLMLIFVVLATEAQRHIPITYAGRGSVSGQRSGLPIRLNQAGMIPIIFAVSILTFPTVMAQFFKVSASTKLQSVGDFILRYLNTTNPSYFYLVAYFLLVVAFSYFYVSITFRPDDVAETIQKRGGFIPGIRPGSQTAEFLSTVSGRLNLFGGVFLALIAVVPLLFTKFSTLNAGDLIISGSGMIIVVGVVLEIIRQVNAQMVMHDYDKMY